MAEIIVLDEIKTSAKHGIVTRTDRVADGTGKPLDTILEELDEKASQGGGTKVEPITGDVPSSAQTLKGIKIADVAYKVPEGGGGTASEYDYSEEIRKTKKAHADDPDLITLGEFLNNYTYAEGNDPIELTGSEREEAIRKINKFLDFYYNTDIEHCELKQCRDFMYFGGDDCPRYECAGNYDATPTLYYSAITQLGQSAGFLLDSSNAFEDDGETLKINIKNDYKQFDSNINISDSTAPEGSLNLSYIEHDGTYYKIPSTGDKIHVVESFPASGINDGHIYIKKGEDKNETVVTTEYTDPVTAKYGKGYSLPTFGFYKLLYIMFYRHSSSVTTASNIDGVTGNNGFVLPKLNITRKRSHKEAYEACYQKPESEWSAAEKAAYEADASMYAFAFEFDTSTTSVDTTIKHNLLYTGTYKYAYSAGWVCPLNAGTYSAPCFIDLTGAKTVELRSSNYDSSYSFTFPAHALYIGESLPSDCPMEMWEIFPGYWLSKYEFGSVACEEKREPVTMAERKGGFYWGYSTTKYDAYKKRTEFTALYPDILYSSGKFKGIYASGGSRFFSIREKAGETSTLIETLEVAIPDVKNISVTTTIHSPSELKYGVAESSTSTILKDVGNVKIVTEIPNTNLEEGVIYIVKSQSGSETKMMITKKSADGTLSITDAGGLKINNSAYNPKDVTNIIKSVEVEGKVYSFNDILFDNNANHYTSTNPAQYLPAADAANFPASKIAIIRQYTTSVPKMYMFFNNVWNEISTPSMMAKSIKDCFNYSLTKGLYIKISDTEEQSLLLAGAFRFAYGDNLATSNISGLDDPSYNEFSSTNNTRINDRDSYVRIAHAFKEFDGSKTAFWDLPFCEGSESDINNSTNELRTIKINGVSYSVGQDRQDYYYYPDVQSMPEGHIVNLTRDVIDPLSVDEHITDPVCIWLAPDWRMPNAAEDRMIFDGLFKIDTSDTVFSDTKDVLDFRSKRGELFKDEFYGGRRGTALKYNNYNPKGAAAFTIPETYLPSANLRYVRPTSGFTAIKDEVIRKDRYAGEYEYPHTKEYETGAGNPQAHKYYRTIGSAQEQKFTFRHGTSTCWNMDCDHTRESLYPRFNDIVFSRITFSETAQSYDACSHNMFGGKLYKTTPFYFGECAVAVCDVYPDSTSPTGFKFNNPSSFTQSLVYGKDYLVVTFTLTELSNAEQKATYAEGGPFQRSLAVLLRNVGSTSMSDPGFYFQYGDTFPVHYSNPRNTNYTRLYRRHCPIDCTESESLTDRHDVNIDSYNGGDYSHKESTIENYKFKSNYRDLVDKSKGYLVLDRGCLEYPTASAYNVASGQRIHVNYMYYRLKNFKDDPTATYTIVPKGRYQVVKDSTTGLKKLERIYTFNKEQYDKIMALIAD